jgi:hypothetical protein
LVLFPHILRDIRQSPDRFPGGGLNVWQFRPEFVPTTKSAIREVKKVQRHESPPGESASLVHGNLIGVVRQFYGSIMIIDRRLRANGIVPAWLLGPERFLSGGEHHSIVLLTCMHSEMNFRQIALSIATAISPSRFVK